MMYWNGKSWNTGTSGYRTLYTHIVQVIMRRYRYVATLSVNLRGIHRSQVDSSRKGVNNAEVLFIVTRFPTYNRMVGQFRRNYVYMTSLEWPATDHGLAVVTPYFHNSGSMIVFALRRYLVKIVGYIPISVSTSCHNLRWRSRPWDLCLQFPNTINIRFLGIETWLDLITKLLVGYWGL